MPSSKYNARFVGVQVPLWGETSFGASFLISPFLGASSSSPCFICVRAADCVFHDVPGGWLVVAPRRGYRRGWRWFCDHGQAGAILERYHVYRQSLSFPTLEIPVLQRLGERIVERMLEETDARGRLCRGAGR